MSELLVQVVEIEKITPHPNADKLEIVRAGGWDIVSGIGNNTVGKTAIHVPPEAMISRELADKWGVTPYLSWKPSTELGRVRAASLRGFVSFGFLAPNEENHAVDTDLRESLGIEKYDPPMPNDPGRVRIQHPLFHRYTDIGNLRDHPKALDYSQELIVTEKIHGMNSRIGFIKNEDGVYQQVVGTHRTQREIDDCGIFGTPWDLYRSSLLGMRDMINEDHDYKAILFFGEVFGPGVQDLHYGCTNSQKGYNLFDVSVDGKYLPCKRVNALAKMFDIPIVPILGIGGFTFDGLLEMAEGKTTLGEDDHIREGIVVRPLNEELPWRNGRMIFKVLSGEYLARKNGTEYH